MLTSLCWSCNECRANILCNLHSNFISTPILANEWNRIDKNHVNVKQLKCISLCTPRMAWHFMACQTTALHSTTQHYTDWTKNQNLFGSVCEMANTVIPHARLFFVSIRFVNKHWCTMWSLFCVCISNSRRKIWELFSLESSHEYSALSLNATPAIDDMKSAVRNFRIHYLNWKCRG